jgi:hypothetical protein
MRQKSDQDAATIMKNAEHLLGVFVSAAISRVGAWAARP